MNSLLEAVERAESPAVGNLPERRSTRSREAATSAPAQPPGAAAADDAAAGASQGGSRRGPRPRSAPAGGAASAGSSKQSAQSTAAAAAKACTAPGKARTAPDKPAGKAADATAAAAGGAEQPRPDGGGRSACGSWKLDEKRWWRHTLTDGAALHASQARLTLPRDLFKQLTGRQPADKDQLDVVGAGRQQYSFQYCAGSQHSELQGPHLGQWLADTGAQAGDEVALRGLGSGQVHVRHLPASRSAAASKAAGSPSPAPAAAEAGRGGSGSKRPSRERQTSGAAAKQVAAPAGGGGGRGSKRPSRERQQEGSGAAAAAAGGAQQVAAPAGGGSGRGSKRASRERQQEQGGAAATVAADSDEQCFRSGTSGAEKGWHLDADGWWRRALTPSACGSTKSGKSHTKLGFPAGLFEKLTGEEPGTAENLGVVDAETGEQLTFYYRKDLSGGGSNIMGAALAQWVTDKGAQAGDCIALRASRGSVQVRLMPAGGRAVKRRRSSSEQQEAAPAGAQGSGGGKQAGLTAKGKQSTAAGQAAQRAKRAGGAGAAAAAPHGVDSQLQGEELLNQRIEVLFDKGWYAGLVVEVHRGRREVRYAVCYEDGDFQMELLKPGEWRLLADEAPAAAQERPATASREAGKAEAQQAAGGQRPAAGRDREARHKQRQQRQEQQPAAKVGPAAAATEREEQAEEEEEWQQQPPKKRRRLRRAGSVQAEEAAAAAQQQQQEKQEQPAPAAAAKRRRGGEAAAAATAAAEAKQAEQEPAAASTKPDQARQEQAAAAGSDVPLQAQQEQQQAQQQEQQRQQQQQPGKQPRRGRVAAKEVDRLLGQGQDATALVQAGRSRRKAAEAATAGVQAALQAEQVEEEAMPALPPEVPGAAPAAPVAAAAATAAAAPAAVAAAEAEEVAAGAPAVGPAAAPVEALARQPSHQRRRARGAAAGQPALPPAPVAQQAGGAAGAAAEAGGAAAGAAPLQACYWFDQRKAPFDQNLPRQARTAELRDQFQKDGLEVTSCHDCQEACYKYPCQSGPGCSKTFCHKCTELYRYLLAFGPEEPGQFQLQQRFCAGHCPCCLRICLRSKCRQRSLQQLGGEAPVPHDSQSRQIVMAYHLARRLLPAVEQIMSLQQQEADAARTSLEAAQVAQIGYVGTRRAPHSERALCNRCATCLENLHFHCQACDQDVCPMCAREARKGRAQASVKCSACSASMHSMRFLDDSQLTMLQQARQRLDAALGGGLSGSIGASTAAAADPLPRMLWRLCKGHCGCEHERAEWIEPETDWVQQMQRMAAYMARYAPPPAPAPPLPAKQQQQPPPLPAPLAQKQQQPPPLLPPAQQQPGQQQQVQTAATAQEVPAATVSQEPVQLQQWQQLEPLAAALQPQAAAVNAAQAQQVLQLCLRHLYRGRTAPDWVVSDAAWTPAELQQAQNMIRQLVAPRQAAPVQPPQPPLLLAQPPQLQQPQLPANGAAGQQAPWSRMVARPLPQQGGGWNAAAVMLASASQQAQQPANGLAAGVADALARQQQQLTGGVSLLQPVQGSGMLASEGSAEDGADARPKRQRKLSKKAQEADADGGGEVQGQQQARQAPAQAAAAAAAAGPQPGRQPAAAGQQAAPAAQSRQELSQEEKEERQWWWMAELPDEDVRLASSRGTQDLIWTPHVDQFCPSHRHYQRTIRIFQMLWERGEPIIVRGLRGTMGWTPEAMGRVCKESQSAKLQVIDCSDFSNDHYLMPREFFERYKLCSGDTHAAAGEPLQMLKLKDFPPTRDFKQVMARHHDDFLQLLNRCLPQYTHPTGGALNLATHLPWYTRLPDLGPKGYIAYGREQEHEGEGDSVTKMHEDLSDAINIMLHVQHRPGAPPGKPRCGLQEAEAPGYHGAGAVWDLVRREDRPALRRFLEDALESKIEGCPPFVHKGHVLTRADVHDVLHDQCFMLTAKHRQLLQRDPYNVHVWHVEQYEHEAVWIPGGCAHQVRNLRSSIKVALDFVSPDAVGECLELRGEFRRGAQKELELWQAENGDAPEEDVGSRHYADKLQIGNMVLHGFLHSLSVLEAVAAGSFGAIPRFPPPLEEPWNEPTEEEAAAAAAAAAKPRRQRQREGGGEEEGGEEEEDDGVAREAGRASRGAKRRR